MPHLPLLKRQSYGGVTTGISQLGSSAAGSASEATSSLSRPQIIGVVVAILALTVLAVGLTWWACVRNAKRRDATKEEALRQANGSLQDDDTMGTVPMQQTHHLPSSQARLAERRPSDRTLDEDWSREPLREADSNRASHYEHFNPSYVQEYGTAVGHAHDHRYDAAPIQSPQYDSPRTPFHGAGT